MFALGTDRRLTLARLRDGQRVLAALRRVVALRRSLGLPIYLISIGLIAIWIIGAFFGAGFFFLEHRPVNLVSGSAVTTSDRSAPIVQDRLTSELTSVPAGPPAKADLVSTDIQSGALLTDLTTSPTVPDELAPKPEPQPPAPAAVETPNVAQPPHSAPTRHRRTRHTAHAQSAQPPPGPQLRPPTPQLRPPVQAIQDLFERHSELAK